MNNLNNFFYVHKYLVKIKLTDFVVIVVISSGFSGYDSSTYGIPLPDNNDSFSWDDLVPRPSSPVKGDDHLHVAHVVCVMLVY